MRCTLVVDRTKAKASANWTGCGSMRLLWAVVVGELLYSIETEGVLCICRFVDGYENA
jgi:hypothetical protein